MDTESRFLCTCILVRTTYVRVLDSKVRDEQDEMKKKAAGLDFHNPQSRMHVVHTYSTLNNQHANLLISDPSLK